MTTWHLVTVSYNSAKVLAEHWSGVDLPSWVHWTVVDNASTDDSVSVARSMGATVIELPVNVGFGAANNIGAESIESEFIAFINPDVTLETSSLEIAASFLSARPSTVLAPQLLESSGEAQATGRGLPTLARKIANRLVARGTSTYRIYALPGEQKYISWSMGAAVLMPSRVFESLRWDERFFVYYEDHDLGLRAWSSGFEVILTGDIRWTHAWARDTTSLNLSAWKLEVASMIKFYLRYPHLLLPVWLARLRHPERKLIGSMVGTPQGPTGLLEGNR